MPNPSSSIAASQYGRKDQSIQFSGHDYETGYKRDNFILDNFLEAKLLIRRWFIWQFS